MKYVLFALIVALLIIAAAFLIKSLIKKHTEKQLADYQADLIKQQFEEVESMYNQVRSWRHEYKNHLQTMKAHLQLGQYDELDAYLSTLNDDLVAIDTVIKSGNIMVDAILNSKLSLAKDKNIKTDACAKVPSELPFSETDICSVISNLIDNAVEAVMKIPDEEKRFIRVYVGMLKSQFYISVTNSANGEFKKADGKYLTTKKSGSHGFGLKRIDSIVKKHGGFVNRQDETDVFATEVMLPLKN